MTCATASLISYLSIYRQRRQGLPTASSQFVYCDTFTTLTPRILVALRNYEQLCKFNWMTKVHGELLGRVQTTCASAGLTSYLSISYMLAELSELLIHRLGSPKCVVAGISEYSKFWSQRVPGGSASRVYRSSTNCKITVRVECDTFTTYPTLENTRSIKKLRTNM